MTRSELWTEFMKAAISSGGMVLTMGGIKIRGEIADEALKEFQTRFPEGYVRSSVDHRHTCERCSSLWNCKFVDCHILYTSLCERCCLLKEDK